MSSCRHNSAIKTADPLPQLQQQLRVRDSRFSILSQHEIDAIYAAEYGEPTQQDCNDFFLLFLGLHEDIMKLQRELLEITARGADAMTIAPCFYGRLNVIMKERIETLASGKPLRVEGYPPTYPGPMMLRWVREYDIAMPSLYERTEGLLAAQVQQSLFEAPTTSERNTPPADAPTRRTVLSMSEFLHSGPLDIPASTPSDVGGGAPRLSSRLSDSRLRFIKKVPIDPRSDLCSPRDRRAALAVYDEAIENIKNGKGHHIDVETEAEAKIETILGIRSAAPSHLVFQKNLLLPIDPTYAEPRIEASDDTLGYHASWRLHEWRQDGWPALIPGRAIEKEKTMKGDPSTWRERDWS
ncbi:unnamed protein product [Alternaria alternata]